MFLEIHVDSHLSMMINEVIGRVESMKMKNQKQADIRGFLSKKVFRYGPKITPYLDTFQAV